MSQQPFLLGNGQTGQIWTSFCFIIVFNQATALQHDINVGLALPHDLRLREGGGDISLS